MATAAGPKRSLGTTNDTLDLSLLVAAVATPAAGAVATFLGTVRTPNGGRTVAWIEYEGYAAMIHAEMDRIANEQASRHGLTGMAIWHRLGRCLPGEASIAIVACSPHRDAALAAVKEALTTCKERLPVWKLERTDAGDAWVDGSVVEGSVVP